MFSPWAPDPAAARQAFDLAWTASCDGARFDVASKALGKIYPLALAAIANRAEEFDQELAQSPRQPGVAAAWRSLFGDVFEAARGPVDEKSRLVLAARGPAWLVEDTKLRAPPSREACFGAAREVFNRKGPSRLGQAAACLPPDSHIFTTSAETARSVASQAIGALVHFAADRKEIVNQFQSAFPGELPARTRAVHDVGCSLWTGSAAAAAAAAFSRLGEGRSDAFAATLAASCAPAAAARKLPADWHQALRPGSLNEKDAVFLLLAAPEANFDMCARAAAHLAHPTVAVLHAGLARFASMGAENGQEGLLALAGVARALAAARPSELRDPTARGSRAGSARLIGLNAFELCLRAGMERKSQARPDEAQALASIMMEVAAAGYDPSAEPSSAASTRSKMQQSKNAEAKPWLAILEAVELQASLGAPTPSSSAKGPRL